MYEVMTFANVEFVISFILSAFAAGLQFAGPFFLSKLITFIMDPFAP